MRPAENIEKRIQNIPINTSAKRDKEVLDDILNALEKSKRAQSAIQPNIWRTIMQSKITKIAAAAAIFIAVILGIKYIGTPIDGTSAVFAAAMDSIKQARTFSCTQIYEMTYEDSGKQGKYLLKEVIMFKEPDSERRVRLTSPWPEFVGEITITDFSKHEELTIRPAKKTATLSEKNYYYDVVPNTGKLKLGQLDTSLRDRLLKLSEEAVEDLGDSELNGQHVRMFQTQKGNRVTTVWINPANNLPVQIEHKRVDQSYSPIIYASIQIDTELDDKLFSLEPPEGYSFEVVHPGWSDYQKKISAKMRYLSLYCSMYTSQNNGQYPKELAELKEEGVTEPVLKNLLASDEKQDGTVVIRYRPPREKAEPSTEVILYEIFEKWPEDGAVICFADGHAEIIRDQNRFEQLIK